MDHLANRNAARLFPIRVRCLCHGHPYVQGETWHDWVRYPQRMGWKWNGYLFERDSDSVAAREDLKPAKATEKLSGDGFLQQWLWFGLLEEVTGLRGYHSDFVLTNNFLQRPLTEQEMAHLHIRDLIPQGGINDLPAPSLELDLIPPGPLITTTKLNDHLAAWRVKVQCETFENQREMAMNARHLLEVAQSWAARMCVYWNGPFAPDEPLPRSEMGHGTDQSLVLSIFVLVETLRGACAYVFNDNYIPILDYHPEQPEILIRRFKKCHWCPNRIRWAMSFGLCCAYVLSSAPMGGKEAEHNHCTDDDCMVNNIDESTYETAHAIMCIYRLKEAEKCPHFSSDATQSVSKIIKDGGIPAVYFDGKKLQVLSALEHQRPFTALSHVWSDGLGNVRENSLPECQLERLQDIVDKLDVSYNALEEEWARPSPNSETNNPAVDHGGNPQQEAFEAPSLRRIRQNHRVKKRNFFWIDTLCIPVSPPHLRKAAISRINETFRKAKRVLILDERLEISNPPGVPSKATITLVGASEVSEITLATTTEGLLTQLACSAWMRRCWTFSEGSLAAELYIGLQDGFMSYDHILWRFFQDRESRLAANGIGKLIEGMLDVRKSQPRVRESFAFRDGLGESSPVPKQLQFPSEAAAKLYNRVADVLAPMSLRATTKPEDEAICIGSSLGIDLRQIQSTKEAKDRMIQLLLALEFIPSEILYLPNEKMRDHPGFGWAPLSFLNGGITSQLARIPAARVTANGLLHCGRAYSFTSVFPKLHPEGFVLKIVGQANNHAYHVQKRAIEPWDATKQIFGLGEDLIKELSERHLGMDQAFDAAAAVAETFTSFVLFTPMKQLGSPLPSIGALARVLGFDEAEDELSTETGNLTLTDHDSNNARRRHDNEDPRSPRKPSKDSVIKVKYEHAVTINTRHEGQFGKLFEVAEAQPNRGILDFGFMAHETRKDQLWLFT